MNSDEAYKIIEHLPFNQRKAIGYLMRECLIVGRDFGLVSDRIPYTTEARIAISDYKMFHRGADKLMEVGGQDG